MTRPAGAKTEEKKTAPPQEKKAEEKKQDESKKPAPAVEKKAEDKKAAAIPPANAQAQKGDAVEAYSENVAKRRKEVVAKLGYDLFEALKNPTYDTSKLEVRNKHANTHRTHTAHTIVATELTVFAADIPHRA